MLEIKWAGLESNQRCFYVGDLQSLALATRHTYPFLPIHNNKYTDNTIKNITNGIHKGDVTHHQDQSIVLVSFKIKNTMNNVDGKLKEIDIDLLLLI